MYIRPLRNAEPPIIPRARLGQFLEDVFHNHDELYRHHRALVDKLHHLQREEHPRIRSITAVIFDAALNFREAYMEYIPNYPIAAYRIDDEMATNPAFKAFVNVSLYFYRDTNSIFDVLFSECRSTSRCSPPGYEELH